MNSFTVSTTLNHIPPFFKALFPNPTLPIDLVRTKPCKEPKFQTPRLEYLILFQISNTTSISLISSIPQQNHTSDLLLSAGNQTSPPSPVLTSKIRCREIRRRLALDGYNSKSDGNSMAKKNVDGFLGLRVKIPCRVLSARSRVSVRFWPP
ncbi:hypothetical protein HanPI659440_Chr14g0547031 [Helianthus annuus]|nr:hypothetical protein HanPI659440_Chr14g0547031 [Helianthus annuus]